MSTQYAYLIQRTDEGRDDDRRVMSLGTLTVDDHLAPHALADELLAENRAAHSYYTGPRRCWVWAHESDGPVPRTAPEGVEPVDG